MSESYEVLKKLSDDELISKHDAHAKNTVVGTNHYLTELARRDNARINKSMLRFTRWITIMTGIMLAFTITNVLVAIFK